MLRPSSYHRPQSPTEYLETQLQSPVTAREAGYPLAFRTQARSVQDDAYLDSAATPAKISRIGGGRTLDRQAVPSFREQQDRVLPSIEGTTHNVESSMVHRNHNDFSARLIEQEVQPHAAQQNLPILIRSGHSPVMPRIIELDECNDNHLPKRRRVTELAYRQSNPVSVVTSQMAQTDVSGSRPGRIEWIESDLSSRRPTQRDAVHLYGLEPDSHNQRDGTHRRVQSTTESTHYYEPSFRSMNVVDRNQQYWDSHHVVSRSTHGEFARDVGYQDAPSGQRIDKAQILLQSGAARLPSHRTVSYDTSFSADRLPNLHEVDQTSHSTQLVRARPWDEDHTNVYPMYRADSQTNASQALHYVRISDRDQFRPIYIDESVQLAPGDSVRRETSTRDFVMGAKEYVRYEQTPDDEQFAGRPYPIYRRPAADSPQQPPAFTAELRQVGKNRRPLSYEYTNENARKSEPLLRSYRDNANPQASSEEVSALPGYVPLRAEQRR